MKRLLIRFAIVVAILAIIYLLGPAPATPVYNNALPAITANGGALDSLVAAAEAKHHLKPNNEARIVWNDSTKTSTPYAIVYLHGFSASQFEGDPIHRNLAKWFGCNLYLSRLAEHGIDTTEQLIGLTPEAYWESAKQALAIGKQLGRKVIVMGTSTGGSLALQLAATYPNDVAGLILYSPNIRINDSKAWLLNNHWGLQIARLVKKSDYIVSTDTNKLRLQYWNKPYRLEAAVALQEYLETAMTESTFSKIHQPILSLYYYKDSIHQDSVVKVSAIKDMMRAVSTPANLKREVAIPNAGTHVIGCSLTSHDVASVEAETIRFLETIMHITPIKN